MTLSTKNLLERYLYYLYFTYFNHKKSRIRETLNLLTDADNRTPWLNRPSGPIQWKDLTHLTHYYPFVHCSVHSALITAQCPLPSVHCAVVIGHCPPCRVQSALSIMCYKLSIVQCAVSTMYYPLCSVHCALSTKGMSTMQTADCSVQK